MHGLSQINRMNRAVEVAKFDAKVYAWLRIAGISLAVVGLFTFAITMV